jgi:hypothetical protein
MKFPLKMVWTEKKADLRQWAFHNIVIGLAPVLVSWIILAFGGVVELTGSFLDGTLMIFGVTLSGASLGFFAEQTKLRLKEFEGGIFAGLLITVILGTCGFTGVIALARFAPHVLFNPAVFMLSLTVVILACVFNFKLAAVRLAYSDEMLLKRMQEFETAHLRKKAEEAQEVGGVKL